MTCNMCFFYAVSDKSCAERHNMPAEKEKCYSFTSQMDIPLSQEEIWAVVDMLLYVRDRGENEALSSFYDKIRMIISPSKIYEKDPLLSFEER